MTNSVDTDEPAPTVRQLLQELSHLGQLHCLQKCKYTLLAWEWLKKQILQAGNIESVNNFLLDNKILWTVGHKQMTKF